MFPVIRRRARNALCGAAILVVLGAVSAGQVGVRPVTEAGGTGAAAGSGDVYGPWADPPPSPGTPRPPPVVPPAEPSAPATPSGPSGSSAPPTSPSAPSASPDPSESSPPDDPSAAVHRALDALPEPAAPERYALAIADPASGASAVEGSGHFETASIVKADILAALLLQAQDNGVPLTARQDRLADDMIRHSDNDAADDLWADIGHAPGLDEANERLGLGHTTAAAGGTWGLTSTTAADQLKLLRAVFLGAPSPGASAPLDADSRRYVRNLMGTVQPDQAWGISAAADDPDEAALKNGWLPRSDTGLWDVNSIGRVRYDGHTFLLAVLSDGHPTEQAGIDLVERVATTAVTAMAR